MSWLSEMFGGSSNVTIVPPSPEQVANYYKQVKINNPAMYEQIKANDPDYIASQAAPSPAPDPGPAPAPAPAPPQTGGAEDALRRLNEALPSGFESTYLPDTLDDPFIASRVASGRGKADEFISNMLRRGTLSEVGRKNAVSLLDAQTPGVTGKLSGFGSNLINADRAKLTDLANTGRATAGQTPFGTDYDPTPLVNQIAAAGSGAAGSFGERFGASIPAGDLYDLSGISGVAGAVSGPQNLSYDPYAQEGGKLTTGLDNQGAPPAKKKRTTAVF